MDLNTEKESVFYHNYVCPSIVCLKSANPQPGSWHQRGLHLATDQPRTDVKCPGCASAMVIGRDGDPSTYKEDKEGNVILIGNPTIYPAPGQLDQSGDKSIFIERAA